MIDAPALEILDPDTRQLLEGAIVAHEQVEEAKRLRPYDFYEPHDRGQLQFHQAPHIVRCLWPGNGFGKTRAMGTEVSWWVHHRHPFQQTPKWPTIGIWAAETFKQFDILREQLVSECFGPERSRLCPWGWRFNKSDNLFEWLDGSRLFLISGDSSWTAVQGVNPDYIALDEEPPKKLWNELKMRRRGRRKTRYMFAATATQGLTWMYAELYLDWLAHHAELGYSEPQAMAVQSHPRIWGWPRGGINDNPGADAGDRDWYASQKFASEAERQVRLGGGFADFSGKPVFDLSALEEMKPGLSEGQDGWLMPKRGVSPDVAGRVFQWEPGATDPDAGGPRGYIRVFELPDPSGHKYVIGHDSAYGLDDGDFDYAVVLDRNTGRQVAEAQGHWGDARWAEVLHALHWFYGNPLKVGAFTLGERQVGLMVMRRLMDEMGCGYQFYDRDEAKRARRRSDTLGHHRRPGDLVIPRLRRAIGPKNLRGELGDSDIRIASIELHRQCCKYQFRPRSSTVLMEEAHDGQIVTGAPAGDHDDGVMALAYANMALHEVERFEEEEASYAEGTYGAQFKHLLKKIDPVARAREPVKPPDPFNQE